MKLLIDVSKLEAEGKVTPDQASEIRAIAAAETTSLAINLLSFLGVAAIVGGVVALAPSALVAGSLGAGLIAFGLWLRWFKSGTFGLLGNSLTLIGALLHCGAVLADWHGSAVSFAYVTVVLPALGTALKHGLFIMLRVFSIAALLGSSTGYWHAAYALTVKEAAITIALFSLLAVAAYAISRRFKGYARLARIFALLSVIWVNFGFWVGSLWGDYPAASWLRPDLLYGAGNQRQLRQWHDHAFFIPAEYFAALWAVGLISLGVWAAIKNQRAVVNTVTTFAAIHFYTQWFERLNTSAAMVIAAGAIAVGGAFLLWRYNRKGSLAAASQTG